MFEPLFWDVLPLTFIIVSINTGGQTDVGDNIIILTGLITLLAKK